MLIKNYNFFNTFCSLAGFHKTNTHDLQLGLDIVSGVVDVGSKRVVLDEDSQTTVLELGLLTLGGLGIESEADNLGGGLINEGLLAHLVTEKLDEVVLQATQVPVDNLSVAILVSALLGGTSDDVPVDLKGIGNTSGGIDGLKELVTLGLSIADGGAGLEGKTITLEAVIEVVGNVVDVGAEAVRSALHEQDTVDNANANIVTVVSLLPLSLSDDLERDLLGSASRDESLLLHVVLDVASEARCKGRQVPVVDNLSDSVSVILLLVLGDLGQETSKVDLKGEVNASSLLK